MSGHLRASAVVSRFVCYADIRLGIVVDVLLDDSLGRVLGFDVRCGDGAHRYLPLLACEVEDGRIAVPSALVLVSQEVAFYRERGRALTAIRGFPARRGERVLGTVADIVFAPGGDEVELVVEADGEHRVVSADDALVVGPDALRPAV